MDAIVTIASIPAILALVQLAKQFGIQGKWSTLLAVVLGVVLQSGDAAFISGASTPAEWWAAIGTGLVLGLSAAGLYDTARIASASPASGVLTVGTIKAGPIVTTLPIASPAEPAIGGSTPRAPTAGGVTSVPNTDNPSGE